MASSSFVPSIPSGPQAFLPPADPAAAGASRVPLVRGVAVFCMLALTIITSLRLYTRRCLVRTVGADDYLAVVAWVSGRKKNASCHGKMRPRDRRPLTHTFAF